MKLKINIERADNGAELQIVEKVEADYAQRRDTGWSSVADWMLARFGGHVGAAMRRGGIEVEDGQPITLESLAELIRARSGLDIKELSADGVSKAVEERLARALSEQLGVPVTQVFDADALRAQVKAGLLEHLTRGGGAGILTYATTHRVRDTAALLAAGKEPSDKQKAQARLRQRKYRRTHKLQWI